MADRPNVILVNCDDLGWGDPACYGHPRHKTPHLDRMAREGTRFTDFYMASPVCSPSRGAMLTGCYPRRIGFGEFEGRWVLFPGQGVGLDPREQTIAGCLKETGYATRIVGKWHCGDQPEFLPTRHGFDGYYGIPYSNDMGRQGDRLSFPPLPLMRDESIVEQQPDQVSITARYIEDAVRFIREQKSGPFFLYLAHMYVHLPLYVPERFSRESENGRYGAAVAAIDWAMGVLLAELSRLGIDHETMVLFTSDNGSRNDFGDSNGSLRGKKGQTWEGGQRVPLIVRWPGVVPDGRVTSEIASAIDLFPTIASLCGTRPASRGPIDGVDLSDHLLGKSDESPRTEFGYFHFNSLEAVRSGPWKLHFRKRDEVINELYNLERDSGETDNVYDSEPEVVARLSSIAERLRSEIGDEATGQTGNCRPIGRVERPETLTHYDPDYPYYMAEYDLTEAG
jgi:arylsulfatase A-like enzyme